MSVRARGDTKSYPAPLLVREVAPTGGPAAVLVRRTAASASTHIVVRSGNARVTAAVRLVTCSLT